jgi:ribosomal protein S6
MKLFLDMTLVLTDFIREKKGRIWRLNDWGLRELAYEVKKAVEAHYILMNFEIDTRFINDFKTMLDKDERVIRHLVTKQDKAETEYSPPPMDYPTLLAKQGLGDDDGFWDEEDDDEDGNATGGGEDDGEVIYVDGDGEEGHEEPMDVMLKVENVRR